MFDLVIGKAAAALVLGSTFFQPPTPYEFTDSFDPECPGASFRVDVAGRGVDSLRNVPGSDGQMFLLTDTYRNVVTWTNLDTGRTATITSQATVRESNPLPVSVADVPPELVPDEGLVGPVYQSRMSLIGSPYTLRDDTGRVVLREYGILEFELLFDTLGDGRPGGVTLSLEVLRDVGSHPTQDTGFDECAMITSLTAGP